MNLTKTPAPILLRIFSPREIRTLKEALRWHILEREEASHWDHGGNKAATDSKMAAQILARLPGGGK